MNILLVGPAPMSGIEERWASLGITVTQVSPAQVLDLLNSAVDRQQLIADAIVLVSNRQPRAARGPNNILSAIAAVELATRIRQLHEYVAMPDGRRWSGLPIRILASSADIDGTRGLIVRLLEIGFADIHVHESSITGDFGAAALKADIRNYRQNVLNELDNLGFIVTYEAGRYRLGPALKPRPDLVGYYYFGPADMRPDRFVTVDRDLVGVQLEVELLEALLNKKDTSEGDFQKFFAEYPHFLSTLAIPMPHVQLRDETGKLLVPDFILKPIVATQRDSRWEVLDLKKPQASLIVGKGSRRRLSHNVQEAIRQLRDYGDYFADPRNGGTVERALGHRLRRPKLGVLIGRMVASELEALEIEQNRLPDVRIITYDEILDQQRALGS